MPRAFISDTKAGEYRPIIEEMTFGDRADIA
jgi:hypothetical protein